MATRLTLNHALDSSADKLAIIRHGSAYATSGNVTADPVINRSRPAELPAHSGQIESAASNQAQPEAVGSAAPRSEIVRPSLLGEVLVPLTTRIRPETANALRRAYLEQKLAHRTPATQQEIIEAALTTWLQQNGFL